MSSTRNLQVLSDELILALYSYLSLHEINKASRVNKRLSKLLLEDSETASQNWKWLSQLNAGIFLPIYRKSNLSPIEYQLDISSQRTGKNFLPRMQRYQFFSERHFESKHFLQREESKYFRNEIVGAGSVLKLAMEFFQLSPITLGVMTGAEFVLCWGVIFLLAASSGAVLGSMERGRSRHHQRMVEIEVSECDRSFQDLFTREDEPEESFELRR